MLRADTHPAGMREDYTFDFDHGEYTPEDHVIWHELCERQKPLLKGRACEEYLRSLDSLSIVTEGGIPDMRRISDLLMRKTGWKLVAVPGLIPGEAFHSHLAQRQFPVTWWIRKREQMAYLQEPDIFHDLFGHVPLLADPVFADYIQQFGQGAMKAGSLGAGDLLARLYWYTVEFGLIRTPQGLRIYGAGIVSSGKESVYCLESPAPSRIAFDVERILRTEYFIDDVQKTYFVIDGFEQLFEATAPDFTELYKKISSLPPIKADEVLPSDRLAG